MTLLTSAFAQGTHSARPAASSSNNGFYYFETDTLSLFQSTGSAWTQIGGVGATSPLTTKGDLWGYDTGNDRIPVGTDGQVLTADSTQPLGLKWAAGGGVGTDGWIDDTAETWTYASATTFTVSGDKTAKYTKGTRIKLTQSSTVKYFVVTGASFSTNTTVTITGGTDYTLANSTVTANFHSYSVNPQGYPTWFVYTPTFTGFSSESSVQFLFSVVGTTVFMRCRVVGTSNAATLKFSLPITGRSSSGHDVNFDVAAIFRTMDNGNWTNKLSYVTLGVTDYNTADVSPDASSNFTSSGMKIAIGQFFYEMA